jgi:outer membrane protein assembly factor BamE (lipoprotein component of BamABCDE complex)
MKRTIGLLLIIGLLAGCFSMGRKIDQSAADKIEKGKTTKEQVLYLTGSPDQIMRLGNGDTTFTYTYIRSTAKPATFIPFIGAFVGGANVQQQMFSVTFGPDNIVKNLFSTQAATESGMGLNTGSASRIPSVEQDKRPR